MSEPVSDIEDRLTRTLRAVAVQTEAPPDGLERLRAAAVAHQDLPARYSRPGYRRLAAVAAVLVLSVGGGVWAVTATDRSHQSTSAGAGTPDRLRVADLTPATGPLYLLPPEGADLPEEVTYWDDPPVDTGTGLVVGRLTDTGFDDVVLVAHLTSGPSFGDGGSVTEIAGRELQQPSGGDGTDGTWTAAEQLADGTWIEYTTLAGADVLAQAVAGTTLVNGRLALGPEAGGLTELGRMADLQGSRPTWLSFSAGDAPESTSAVLIRTRVYDPELGLAFAGVYGPAEQTTLDGRPAFLIRPRLDVGPPTLMLTWATASGHVVELIGQMGENELRSFASRLRTVDRPTWEAELAPYADPGS